MAQANTLRRAKTGATTHEGARAMSENPIKALQRVLNAHMLFEDKFYLDGQSAADALVMAVRKAISYDADETARVITAARRVHNIRHASLLAAVEFAKSDADNRHLVLQHVISRADELAEALALAGARKAPHAVMRAVRRAFEDGRFDEYQFAKYKGEGRSITLRDAVFLTHPSPKKYPLIQKIVDGTLEVPNTWETRLSSGEDKREVFEDLLRTNKLGAMALLRNLNNMDEAKVDWKLVKDAFEKANWSKVLPFRFLTAQIFGPKRAVAMLDDAFEKAVAGSVELDGRTAVLVDHSGSMQSVVSAKSRMQMWQVGNAMAAAIRGDADLYFWGTTCKQAHNWQRLSSALQSYDGSVGYGTNLGQALNYAQSKGDYTRFIVLTDMQFADNVMPRIDAGQTGYTINLNPYGNAGLIGGKWTHLTGYSTATLKYIAEAEKLG